MSDLANRLWAKGFKPNLGEPWTQADHRRVDELREEIERQEELLEEFQEKSSALLAKSLGQNKEIERLRAWKSFVIANMYCDANYFEDKPYRHWFALFSATKNPDKAIEREVLKEKSNE